MSRKALNIEDTRRVIEPILETDNSENRLAVLIRGDHGIGKSDLVYEYGREYYDEDHIIERRASQMVEGDLIGMPDTLNEASIPVQVATRWLLNRDIEDDLESAPAFIQSAVEWVLGDDYLLDLIETVKEKYDIPYTKWKPPEWLHKACQEPCLLFFDEVDRALVAVRQGLFELTGSRRLYGNELHPQTQIFAAINGGADVTDYTVGEMDPAELDRWFTIDLEPTHEEWLDWAGENDINAYVFEFISENPDHLEHNGEHSPMQRYPSRRSWHRFSNILNQEFGSQKPDPEFCYLHGQGHVGPETALKFHEFVKQYEDHFSIEDVLNDEGDVIEEMKQKPMTVQNEICQQFDAKYDGSELEGDELHNLGRFLIAVDDETCMKLFKSISDRDARNEIFDIPLEDVDQNVEDRPELEDPEDVGDYVLGLYESSDKLQEEDVPGE